MAEGFPCCTVPYRDQCHCTKMLVLYIKNCRKVRKKTWSRYFLGDSLLSGGGGGRYFHDLLEATNF